MPAGGIVLTPAVLRQRFRKAIAGVGVTAEPASTVLPQLRTRMFTKMKATAVTSMNVSSLAMANP